MYLGQTESDFSIDWEYNGTLFCKYFTTFAPRRLIHMGGSAWLFAYQVVECVVKTSEIQEHPYHGNKGLPSVQIWRRDIF